MYTTAQKRSLLNKLKEKSNIGGIAAEKIFNPEFQRVMDVLREIDNNLRSVILGKSIDGGDPGDDEMSMEKLLSEALKNLNRREYMTSVAFLGRFHKKAHDINSLLQNVDLEVNKVHEDFLFKDLEDEHKPYLKSLKDRFSNVVYRKSLLVEAGLQDFLVNIGTNRGRALAAWEKRYPKEVKKLKNDTRNVINKSENFFKFLLSELSQMAKDRAERKVESYIKHVNKIKVNYNKYHDIFYKYYNENVKGFLDRQSFEQEQSEEKPKDQENLQVEQEVEQKHELDKPPTPPIGLEDLAQEESSSFETNLFKDVDLFSKSDLNFLNTLKLLKSESPVVLAKNIDNYANKIVSKNNLVAARLKLLAKNIRER